MMLDHIFSIAERLIPRLISAGMVFVLAYFTDPFTVGLYSAVMLAYTFIQSTAESAVRQVLPSVLNDPRFLRRYAWFSGTVIAGGLIAVALVIALTSPPHLRTMALSLAVIAVAPLFNALSLRFVGLLQVAGRWPILAKNQVLSTFAAGVISVTVMFLGFPLLGAASFLVVSELSNFLLSRSSARAIELGSRTPPVPAARELLGVAGYSGAGWLQGQADRVLFSFLAGVAALGSFSVASSLSRAVGDPVAAATSNLLRVHLAETSTEEQARTVASSALLRSLLLAAITSALIVVTSETLGRLILNEKWDTALALVPVLTITVFFVVLNSSLGMLQVFFKNLRRAIIIPFSAIAAAPFIAIAASHSLYLAAWLVVAREAFITCAAYLALGGRAPLKPLLLAFSLSAAFAADALVLSFTIGQ